MNAAQAVQKITDGVDVADPDWPQGDPTLDQLRILYLIGRIHRDAHALTGEVGVTVGVPAPASAGQTNARWFHFDLLDRIGNGTSGVVHRAWDTRLAREVALKLIVPLPGTGETFLGEARRLARVRHPHVVAVYGVDHSAGQVGTWMELLRGRTLFDVVREQGPLSAGEAALVGADVCSALAAVHAAGLLHRDTKPQNVFREHGGRIVLMDLGSGHEIDPEGTGDLAGTPLYMAPELFQGKPASVASDIYSVGVVLFFLTTGETPIVAPTIEALRRAHTDGPPRALRDVRPDLPREFVDIVDRALATDAGRRFPSAGELERALTAAASQRTHAGQARGTAGRNMFSRRIPAWGAIALSVAAAIVATVVGNSPLFRSAGGSTTVTGSAAPFALPVRPIAPDQLKIARGFEDLAISLGDQAQWTRAAEAYREAERIYRVNTSPDAPVVAVTMGRIGWALASSGQLDAAQSEYELAIAKLRVFNLYPQMAVVFAALALTHEKALRYDEAAIALANALDHRAHAMSPGNDRHVGLARIGVPPAKLTGLMASYLLDSDEDSDGLPDLIEAAVGLNPRSRDTNRNGVHDGDEDHDGDGLSNTIEFGLTLNPTRLIAHNGALDPAWLGFQQTVDREFLGHSVDAGRPEASWNIAGPGITQYCIPLNPLQATRAYAHGWTLATRGALHAGAAFAYFDLGSDVPRFDLYWYDNTTGGLTVRLNSGVVPVGGVTDLGSTTERWPLTQLDYDPSTKSAALRINGVRRAIDPYFGHKQFREAYGLCFGGHDDFGKVASSNIDFSLAMLVIR